MTEKERLQTQTASTGVFAAFLFLGVSNLHHHSATHAKSVQKRNLCAKFNPKKLHETLRVDVDLDFIFRGGSDLYAPSLHIFRQIYRGFGLNK